MINWFDSRARLLQLLLLLIPGVNYIILILYFGCMLIKEKTIGSFLVFIFYLILGIVLAYINFFIIIFKHYLLFSKKKDV